VNAIILIIVATKKRGQIVQKKNYNVDKILTEICNKVEEGIKGDDKTKWSMPWHCADFKLPTNVMNYEYQGLNTLWLWMVKEKVGYSSNQWGTYQQWTNIGGSVAGQSATAHHQYILQPTIIQDKEDETKTFTRWKTWAVFNRDQVSGLPDTPKVQPFECQYMLDDFHKHQAELFVKCTDAVINHGGDRAYYRPSEDRIQMPEITKFKTDIEYYSTLFHELSHWSGAEKRLNRNLKGDRKQYAFEELVAEMSACLLSAKLGISSAPTQNTIAYCQSWMQALKEKPKRIWDATSLAKNAVNYLSALQEEKLKRVA